jgi:UDP-2,4-diacetamido-2,4,6-trideoxy-beta-L-altropyranose hydrolase
MNVFFRADASQKIGIGHIMRCLTLAIGLKRLGCRISFISRNLPNHLSNLLMDNKIGLLDVDHPPSNIQESFHSWLGTSQELDAKETIKLLGGRKCDLLIVDHYALDYVWEDSLMPNTKLLFVIDDLADRRHNCHYLLDQNLFADMGKRYTNLVPVNCKMLLGPNFALLRNEFYLERRKLNGHTGTLRRILVSLGGVDVMNITEKVIIAIFECGNELEVDVVIGFNHPAKERILNLCSRYSYQCHIQTKNISKLMASADLAIGSSGSTSWERCCLGLPTICITQASNQIPIANGLEEVGALLNLGDFETLSINSIKHSIYSLILNPQMIIDMSNAGLKLVDGKGTSRILNEIFQ